MGSVKERDGRSGFCLGLECVRRKFHEYSESSDVTEEKMTGRKYLKFLMFCIFGHGLAGAHTDLH